MAKAKSTKTKKQAKSPPASSEPRQVKKPVYRSFKLSKRLKAEKLPSAFKLFGGATAMLRRHWKVFLGIVLIYGLLNALLVQGFSANGNLDDAKSTLDQAFTGNWGQLASGVTIFAYLLSASGNTASPAAGVYQSMLVLVVSLALIWALRQVYADNKIRVRDAFYRGMTPLVPFVLVLVIIVLQLIPMAIGLMLYGAVTANGIAVTVIEEVLWALLAIVTTFVTMYMISSSLFALYIVTLPDMTPLGALRSARQLVARRRWQTMRKVVFLPLALLVLAGITVVPVILFATAQATIVFFVLTMLLLPITHAYMYGLYRSML